MCFPQACQPSYILRLILKPYAYTFALYLPTLHVSLILLHWYHV